METKSTKRQKQRVGELWSCGKLVILVTGKGDELDYFAGVVIRTNDEWPVGMYSTTWEANAFRKFYCSVSLTGTRQPKNVN